VSTGKARRTRGQHRTRGAADAGSASSCHGSRRAEGGCHPPRWREPPTAPRLHTRATSHGFARWGEVGRSVAALAWGGGGGQPRVGAEPVVDGRGWGRDWRRTAAGGGGVAADGWRRATVGGVGGGRARVKVEAVHR
jgi:hypothetical protein